MAAKYKEKKEEAVNWVKQDIRNGEFKNIYLLYGEEEYLKRAYAKGLIKALGITDDGMNYNILKEKDASAEAIISIADTVPFFVEKRLVWVQNSGLFKSGDDTLAAYLEHVPASTVLIFSEKEVDKSRKPYKRAEKYGRAVEYGILEGEALVKTILQYIQKAGKGIRRSTMDYFLEQTGHDLTGIINELEKLICYTEGREEITKEDVELLVTNTTEQKIYMLTGALADRDPKQALKYYYELMQMKTIRPAGVINATIKSFRLLLEVRELKEHGNDSDEISKKLSLNPRRTPILIRQASAYTVKELLDIVEDCVNARMNIEMYGMNEYLQAEKMLLKHSVRR